MPFRSGDAKSIIMLLRRKNAQMISSKCVRWFTLGFGIIFFFFSLFLIRFNAPSAVSPHSVEQNVYRIDLTFSHTWKNLTHIVFFFFCLSSFFFFFPFSKHRTVIMSNSSAPWWPFALKFIVQMIVAQQIIFSINNSLVACIDGQQHTTDEGSTATAASSANAGSVTSPVRPSPSRLLPPTATTISQRNESIDNGGNNIEHESINVLGTAAALKSNDGGHLGAASRCTLAEYTCTNGQCVPANKFCDKVNDCGDNSDEPRVCSRK